MSKLPKAFKRKNYGDMKDFSAIPPAEYVVKITKSEYKANSKKNGHIIALVLEVQNKEHKGAKIFVNLNVDNPSDQAVEIANNELGTICDAIGKASIKDTDELMGKLMIVKLTIKNEKNEVAMYSSMDSAGGSAGGELEDDDDDDDNSSDNSSDDDDAVDPDEVKVLAKKVKKIAGGDDLKDALEEYDISKIKEISDLDEDDLESLKEDLEELIEDAG